MRFAIVSMGRTGSTLLVSLLNSHPDIECAGELFNPYNGAFRNHPDLTAQEFLAHRAYKTDRPIRGFKMPFDWVLEHPTIFADLKALDYRIIRLQRQDVLSQLLSIKLATMNDQWNDVIGYWKQETSIGIEEFLTFLGSRSIIEHTLDKFSAGLPMHAIYYEQIMEPVAHEKVVAFLDAKPALLTTLMTRQRTIPIEKAITNYNSIYPFFSESTYACYFPAPQATALPAPKGNGRTHVWNSPDKPPTDYQPILLRFEKPLADFGLDDGSPLAAAKFSFGWHSPEGWHSGLQVQLAPNIFGGAMSSEVKVQPTGWMQLEDMAKLTDA